MADFYYQSGKDVIGPLTGIQLRDAAIAGHVVLDTLVSNSAQGPWSLALRMKGLFDERGSPLPHPREAQQLISEPRIASGAVDTTPPPLPPPVHEPTPAGPGKEVGSHMATQWFYQTSEGQQSGPVDSRELRRLAEAGIVSPETLIRQGASGRWVRGEKVRGLFQPSTPAPSPSLGASPPPTPPPVARLSTSQVRQEAELARRRRADREPKATGWPTGSSPLPCSDHRASGLSGPRIRYTATDDRTAAVRLF